MLLHWTNISQRRDICNDCSLSSCLRIIGLSDEMLIWGFEVRVSAQESASKLNAIFGHNALSSKASKSSKLSPRPASDFLGGGANLCAPVLSRNPSTRIGILLRVACRSRCPVNRWVWYAKGHRSYWILPQTNAAYYKSESESCAIYCNQERKWAALSAGSPL